MTKPVHHIPSKPKAVEKLAQSQLSQKASQGLQGIDDVDLDSLRLQLKNGIGVKALEAVHDIKIMRTIEGASTVTVELIDDGNKILNSESLNRETDINIDGLWFRLTNIRKQGRTSLDLVFEDREIRILRTIDGKMGPIARTKITRAEFIQKMADEANKTANIQTFIPQLHNIQPVETTQDTQTWGQQQTQGIPKRAGFPAAQQAHRHGETIGLTVKGQPADTTQIKNANTILRVGVSNKASRKVLVCAIMTVITESQIRNLSGGDLDSVGCFQQRKSQGWPASRDVAIDASEFYSRAMGLDRKYPNLPYWQICADVQHPREDLRQKYNEYRAEAERFVTEYGIPGGAFEGTAAGTSDYSDLSGGGDYFYYRGVPPTGANGKWKKENSWDCAQRLAGEVNWRSYMVNGVWYYLTEDYLFKSMPVVEVDDDTEGVQEITFDFDEGKAVAQVEITCFMKRWAAPPGTVVKVNNQGPASNKYLVTQVERSVYEPTGRVTLKRPLPRLPEPAQGNLNSNITWKQPVEDTGQKFRVGTAIINPIPKGMGGDVGGATGPHNTGGLPGYPAYDFFAKAGTPVLAVESGKVRRFSGHEPSLGPIEGAGGPLGWSIYLAGSSGADYFITHLGSRTVYEGQEVTAGMQLGTVADYASFGRDDHAHVGVRPPASGRPNCEDLKDAQQAVKT